MLDNAPAWVFVILATGSTALPIALLLALRAIFIWRYRKSVTYYMGQRSPELPPSAADRSFERKRGPPRRGLTLFSVERQSPLAPLAQRQLDGAHKTSARVRLIFALAGGAQMLLTAGVVHWRLKHSSLGFVYPPLLTAYLSMLPGGVLLAAFALRTFLSRAALLVLYLTLGAILVFAGSDKILANGPEATLSLLWIGLRNSITPLLGVGLLLVRRLRPILILALAIGVVEYAIMMVFGFLLGYEAAASEVNQNLSSIIWISIVNTIGGVVVLFWILPQSNLRRFVIFCILGALAALALVVEWRLVPGLPIAVAEIASGVPVNAFHFFLVWLVFQGFVRLQEQNVLASELLHWDICWLFLAMLAGQTILGYKFYDTSDLSGATALGLIGFAPFAAYALFFHLSLWRMRRGKQGGSPRRLLLLRVFGGASKRVRLLDMLDEGWRRIGRVDFIAGTDLAQRFVAARALEAFLSGRLQTIFLKSAQEVDQRIALLRQELEGDLRYPLNDLYCYSDAWQHAVSRLAPESDVIVMDLRGFSEGNRGCVFELGVLVRVAPLERVILLTDATTDMSALAETIDQAWRDAPEDSVNVRIANAEIALLPFAGSMRTNRELLESRLFSIAFDAA